MTEDLLPCPFCSGAAERLDIPANDNGQEAAGGSCIQCTSCGAASGLHFDRKENLVASWNQRALMDDPVRAELLAAVKEAYALLWLDPAPSAKASAARQTLLQRLTREQRIEAVKSAQ